MLFLIYGIKKGFDLNLKNLFSLHVLVVLDPKFIKLVALDVLWTNGPSDISVKL